jgi:hypothetical protein
VDGGGDGALLERRKTDGGATQLACHRCGSLVELDPKLVRLRHMAATLDCDGCGLIMRVRHSDAYRDPEVGVAWTFASYGQEADNRIPTNRSRTRRWAHRRRPPPPAHGEGLPDLSWLRLASPVQD